MKHRVKQSATVPVQNRIENTRSLPLGAVRYRSGLAAAAGFSGLALIFSRFSLAPLLWAQFPRILDLNNPHEVQLATLFYILVPLPGLLAPLVLWLGMKARKDLKHHPEKSGRFQTGFALTIGLVGTLIMLREIYQVTKVLMVLLS